jgi:hypothetical protein
MAYRIKSVAALTGLTRYTLRAAVMEEPQPSRALQLLNEAVLREESDRFCTAAHLHLQAEPVGLRAWIVSGGHPPALVKNPPRQSAIIDPQRPTFVRAQVDEGKFGCRRALESRIRADGSQV